MFTATMCHEVRECINAIRRETRTRVLVITGAGDKFFCLGGRKEGMEATRLYAGVLPTLEMYESIDQAAEAGYRQRQRLRGRRRQRAPGRLRPHDRQGERDLPPGRADDGQLRCRLRHLVPRGPGRQEEGEGALVPEPQDHGQRGARDRPDQPGRAGRSAPRRDSRLGAGDRLARRLRAGLDQSRLPRPPRRGRRARADGPRPAAAPISGERGVRRSWGPPSPGAARPIPRRSATEPRHRHGPPPDPPRSAHRQALLRGGHLARRHLLHPARGPCGASDPRISPPGMAPGG